MTGGEKHRPASIRLANTDWSTLGSPQVESANDQRFRDILNIHSSGADLNFRKITALKFAQKIQPPRPLESATIPVLPNATPTHYGFGFTAASLRPELLCIVAERFLRTNSWPQTKENVLAANELQCRTATSAQRMEREPRPRLQRLSHRQLVLLVQSGADVRISLAWLAAVKHSSFLFDFAADAIRPKVEQQDFVLRESDYRRFIDEKTPSHPELSKLTESTSGKVRRVLFAMLREAGILTNGDEIGSLQRPVIPHEVEHSIREEDPAWLAAFLVPENEIQTHRRAR